MSEEWQKSSYTTGTNPNCVECRIDDSRVLLRDTQHRHLGHLAFPAAEWRAFLSAVRDREL